MIISGIDDLENAPNWLVQTDRPGGTLDCAASVLCRLGCYPERLIEIMERTTGPATLPGARAFVSGKSVLDAGIELAGTVSGVEIVAQTQFLGPRGRIVQSLDNDIPVILNCFRAPSGLRNHSVLAVGYHRNGRNLLTLDTKDGSFRWMSWFNPTTGAICSATFIRRASLLHIEQERRNAMPH
jgi:hypothetical protein